MIILKQTYENHSSDIPETPFVIQSCEKKKEEKTYYFIIKSTRRRSARARPAVCLPITHTRTYLYCINDITRDNTNGRRASYDLTIYYKYVVHINAVPPGRARTLVIIIANIHLTGINRARSHYSLSLSRHTCGLIYVRVRRVSYTRLERFYENRLKIQARQYIYIYIYMYCRCEFTRPGRLSFFARTRYTRIRF